MGRKKMASDAGAAAPVKFNKSARIRELHDAGRSAKEIKQSLDAGGHETTINTIYTAIANYKKSKASAGGVSAGGAKRGPKPSMAAAPTPSAAPAVYGGRFSIQDIQNIAMLVKASGGYDSFIALLQAMKGIG